MMSTPGMQPTVEQREVLFHNGKAYYSQNVHRVRYKCSRQEVQGKSSGSLIDGGANLGFGGEDVLVIEWTDKTADVTGIDSHKLDDLPIVTCAGLIMTTRGPAIAIMHQYAYHGKGKTIHAPAQLGHFGHDVNDKSVKSPCGNGKQRIITPEGYIIPLDIVDGLAYMKMSKPTDQDMKLPHIILTADMDWDPRCMDHTFTDANGEVTDEYHDALSNTGKFFENFDQRVTLTGEMIHPDDDEYDFHFLDPRERAASHLANNHKTKLKEPDYEALRPNFGWATIEMIKKTFATSTQFFRNMYRLPLRKHFKSRFPGANVGRRNEPVAMDTYFSDTPAIGTVVKMAQIFVGRKTLVTDVYPMQREAQIPCTLEHNIKDRGAMEIIISDGAKAAIGQRIKAICGIYRIKNYQSEPYHQHQNYAENRIGTLKDGTNRVMERSGAPASLWLLALVYVCVLLNHMSNETLGDIAPLTALLGLSPDISMFLAFHFYEPVLYAADNKYPSESTELSGRFVGFAVNQGDAMTFLILTDDTEQVIVRSAVCSRINDKDPNLRQSKAVGEMGHPVSKPVKNCIYEKGSDGARLPDVPTLDVPEGQLGPDELIGRSFLLDADEDGQRLRANIVKKIITFDDETQEKIKTHFLCEVQDSPMDQLMDYHDLLEMLDKQSFNEDGENFFNLMGITAHQGPLTPKDPEYLGSAWNTLVKWEDGSTTYEPLHIMAKDQPDMCAQYALDNNLLELDGWKQFRRRAKNKKTLARKVNQIKKQHKRFAPVFMYGVEIPRDSFQARRLDTKNGNTKWVDSEHLELKQLFDYKFAIDKGPGDQPLPGYTKIRCRMIYAVKHDGRHKARYVAGGHLTKEPEESVYSSVVSLRSLRIIILAAELNGLELFQADVGSAYLEALTGEKICFIAGEEFEFFGMKGHTLILHKALYGLRSSGKCWHSHFSATLRSEGFVPSLADPDVWMRQDLKAGLWEYICVYVDDLALAMLDPKSFIIKLKALPEEGGHGYQIKGDGPLSFHLGCDYVRDRDGTLRAEPKKYIAKMLETYERLYNAPPKHYSCPLEKQDHPELDTSPLLEPEQVSEYLSLMGQLQWLISLGRFDVSSAVAALSTFRSQPREGHLERAKRVVGYVAKFKHAALQFRVCVPDYSHLSSKVEDWAKSVYGNDHEELPHNMPTPLGKIVRITEFVDANLYFDLVTGRACTGILIYLNQTPIDWYCKKQSTVACTTFGSEFVAAKTATEKAYNLCYTLRMMGIPLDYET